MSEEQRMIIDATANMSLNQLKEILSYIRYLQFKSKDVAEAPDDLIIKNDEDFIQKIKEGMEDQEELSFEEVKEKMRKKILLQSGN